LVAAGSAWRVVFTKQAQKDARKLAAAGLRPKAEKLLKLIGSNPFGEPPPFEKLVEDLAAADSRRITIQHRLVYQVLRKDRLVKVIRIYE